MLLVTKGLTKHFGGIAALNNIDFHANQDEITGLIGPNGAGKTTFFNCVTGVHQASGGEITFKGRSLLGSKPDRTAKLGISRTFQNIRVFNKMTVLENVLVSKYACDPGSLLASFLGLKGRGATGADLKREAIDRLEFVGLAHLHDQPAESLSYGDQRRLELARALATNPDLIFLDEPTAGMNPHETEEAIKLFVKIKESGISIILIEHDMKVVMNCCSRVVVLNYGEKLAEGTPAEIRDNPEVINAYLGKGGYHA